MHGHVPMALAEVLRLGGRDAVTALIGAALGIAVGIFLAGLTTLALSDYRVVFALPYRSLAIFVIVAIAAGVLAAILPARRASRLNVLEAPV
jgi:putative ABC transport system permease protein